MVKALILDAFDNYAEVWPDDLLWDRIRDAVAQPGSTETFQASRCQDSSLEGSQERDRDQAAATVAHQVWDATAEALEVVLTRTCAMLLAITDTDVVAISEHAFSQRQEVITERITGSGGEAPGAPVSPGRDPVGVREVFRELSPMIGDLSHKSNSRVNSRLNSTVSESTEDGKREIMPVEVPLAKLT